MKEEFRFWILSSSVEGLQEAFFRELTSRVSLEIFREEVLLWKTPLA